MEGKIEKKGVSVIIPVYNAERYLRKCLNSLEKQSYQDYEVLLVNDGSTDNSQNIIDEYVDKYPEKIPVIYQRKWRTIKCEKLGTAIC